MLLKENLEFINGNKTETAPKSVGKSYHNISARIPPAEDMPWSEDPPSAARTRARQAQPGTIAAPRSDPQEKTGLLPGFPANVPVRA